MEPVKSRGTKEETEKGEYLIMQQCLVVVVGLSDDNGGIALTQIFLKTTQKRHLRYCFGSADVEEREKIKIPYGIEGEVR